MSTTTTASPHRFSYPIAVATAVVVIIGGATLIGVAASQSESTTPTTPAPPVHGKVWNHPGAKTGMGDFNDFIHQRQGGGNHPDPLRGGRVMNGQP